MMSQTASPSPLALDRVERSRAARDHVRLRVAGRWLGPGETPRDGSEALLVVVVHGRRHRFPAIRDPRRDGAPAAPGARFTASFTIPDWAVPAQPGQAHLWVGEAVVPVPPPGTTPATPATSPGAPDVPPLAADVPPVAVDVPPVAPDAPPVMADALPVAVGEPVAGQGAGTADSPFDALAAGAGRTGPLAELLSKEAVAALRAELEQRTAEAVRLRGALAEARRDLQRHREIQAGLESAHAELRDELGRLSAAVAEQREEFERGLAAARAELERAEAERDAAGEQLAGARDERDAARAELTQAREELERVRAQDEQELERVRAQDEQELERVRAQTEQELERTRAQAVEDLAAVRDDAEAQARALGERVTALTAAERASAEEAAALRERLAAAHISREAALAEASGLRAELERIGAELVTLREADEQRGGGLGEARQLLADARALSERLRAESA